MRKQKVVVIGAGPAGLTVAYELLAKYSDRYSVTIIEQSDKIGGISKTIVHKNNRMDIGGHRFFSKNEEVIRWWKNILPLQGTPSIDDKLLNRQKDLPENDVDPNTTDKVMLIRKRISRIYYNNTFFDYPININKNMMKALSFNQLFSIGISYIKSCFIKLPEVSLENFYINRFGKVLYHMFFEGYTEKLWGRHPKNISADWGTQRVKGLSIFKLLKNILFKKSNSQSKNSETSLIEEFWYPKYGPGQLWEEVSNQISSIGGEIVKTCTVKDIILENNSIKKINCNLKGNSVTIDGDIFISTMPLKNLVQSMDYNISEPIKEIAENLPYRDFVTIGVLVDKIKLENKTDIPTFGNIIPDCWIYVQDKNVKLGRIQIFNNWSPYMVEDFENEIWLGLEYFCDKGDSFWNLADKQLIDLAKKELVQIGIIDQNQVIETYHCERVEKAYPAYFDSYKDIDKLKTFLNGIDNLYCIGRNGQHRYNNMDHSMMTAFKTIEAMNGEIDKKEIWNVNTEKEYHESKEDI